MLALEGMFTTVGNTGGDAGGQGLDNVRSHEGRNLQQKGKRIVRTRMSQLRHAGTRTNVNEQALVCLSNEEIVDASRGRTFHCEMANNRCFF